MNMNDYKKFIRDRITQLRMERDISEYQLSLELGQNRSYIQAISSGRALPSMAQFLNICDYFEITPAQFFDPEYRDTSLLNSLVAEIKLASPEDRVLVHDILKRLNDEK